MKKRIFFSMIFVTLFCITLFSVLVSFLLFDSFSNQRFDYLENEANYIASTIKNNDDYVNDFHYFASPSRITLISDKGIVLYDNMHDNILDNHANRPEIIDAFNTGSGEAIRMSDTLGKETYYFALRLYDGNVIRISETSDTIETIFSSIFIYISVAIIIFSVLALFMARYITNLIIKQINLKNPHVYDELLPFVQKISKQESYIKTQKQVLAQKITELDVTAENIADGLILLDSNQNILSVNKRAIKVLSHHSKNFDFIGGPFINLTRNSDISDSLNRAYKGEFVDFIFNLDEKVYKLKFSPVLRESTVVGAVILIIDITKKTETEKIRREFTANVSHELKTPLTSISGYAELLKNGMVRPEDVIPFAENIYNEASILITLIDDIIKLSRLDEDTSEYKYEDIDLKRLLEVTLSRVELLAEDKNIEISRNLVDASMFGVQSILSEIFYNIIQNGIKYNKPNGKLSVDMKIENNEIITIITDSGLGIPKDSVKRIFERFYRVDTSHSKTISGTGLGLSIVKHGVQVHGGRIEVESEVDKYTTFKIYFKKK